MEPIADFNALKSFSIPKRSNLNNEILQVLDSDSREYKDIVQTFNDAARSKPNVQNFSFLKIYHVRNQSMDEEFLERRKFFKTFKDSSATKVAPAFFCANSLKEAKVICSNGLRVGNTKLSHLGDPEKGVYLCKYSDIIQPQPFINDQCGFIIGVNVIKGRVKFMDENHNGEPLDPTPDYECHLSKSLSKLDKDSSQSMLYETSQVYIYEYDEYLEIQKRPRHILPIFVIHFRHQSREAKHFKRNHPKKEKWNANNSPRSVPSVIKFDKEDPNILWKGDLYIQGSNVTGLCLYSIITFPKPDSFLAQTLEVIESVDMQFCFINYDGLDKLGRIGFGIPVTMGNKCYHRAEMRVIGPMLPIHTNLVAFLEKTLKCMVIKLGLNQFLLLLPDCNFVTQNLGYKSESDKCILHGMVVNHITPIQDFSKDYSLASKDINPKSSNFSQQQLTFPQHHLTSEEDDDEDVDFDIIKLKKHAVTSTETAVAPNYDPFSDNGEATTSEDENKLLQKLLSSAGLKVPHFSALSSCTIGKIEKMSMSQDLIDDIVLKQPLKKDSSSEILIDEKKKTGWSDFEFDAKNDQSDDIIKCKDLKRIRKVRKQTRNIRYSEDNDEDTPISRYYKTKSSKSSLTSDNDEDIRSNYSSSFEDTRFSLIPTKKDDFITKKPRLSSIVMPVNKNMPVESILATAFKNAKGTVSNSSGCFVESSNFNMVSGLSGAETKEDNILIGGDTQLSKDKEDLIIQKHLPKFNFGRIWGDGGGSDLKSFISSRIEDIDEHILESILGNSPIENVIGNSPMESVGNLEMNIGEMVIIPIERIDDKVPDIVEGKVRLSLEYDVMLDSMKICIGENELLRKINIDPPNIFADEDEATKFNFNFDVESVVLHDCLIKVIHQRISNKVTSTTLSFVDVNNALHSFKDKPDTRRITFNNEKLIIYVTEDRNEEENIFKDLLGAELFEKGKWKIKKTNFIKLYSEAMNKNKSIPFLDESDFIPGLNIFASSMSANKILSKWPNGLKVVDIDHNAFQRKKTGKLPDIVGIEIITVCDPRLSQDLQEASIYYRKCQDFWKRYHQATEEAWLLNEGGKYYVKIDNGAIQLVLKVNPVDSKMGTSTMTTKPQNYCNENKLNAEDSLISSHKNIFSKKFKKHHKFKDTESEATEIAPINKDIPLPITKEKQSTSIIAKSNESLPFLDDNFLSSTINNRTIENSLVNIVPKSIIEDKNATDYDSDLEARLAEKERLKAEILLLEQRVKEKKLEKARRLAENPHIKTLDNDDFSFSSDSTNLSESFDNATMPLTKSSQNMHPLSSKINENTSTHEVIITSIKTEIFDNFNDMLNEITCSSMSIQQPDSTSTFSNDVKLNILPKNNLPHVEVINNDNVLIDAIREESFLDEGKSCLLSVNTICSTIRECESKMSPDSSNRIENCQEDILKKDLIINVEIKNVERWSHFEGLSAATQFEGQFCENSRVRDTLMKEIREWLKKKPLEIIALGKTGSIDFPAAVLQKEFPSLRDLVISSNASTLFNIICDEFNIITVKLNNFVEMCIDGRFVDYFKEMDEFDIINAQNNDEDNFLSNQVLRVNLEVAPHGNDVINANVTLIKECEKSSEDFDFMNDRINAEIKSNFEKVHRKIKKRKIKKLKPIHKISNRLNTQLNVRDKDLDFDMDDANKWLDDSFIQKCILEANKAIINNKIIQENTRISSSKTFSIEKSGITAFSPKSESNLADVKFTKEFDAVADQILENVYTSRLERKKKKVPTATLR